MAAQTQADNETIFVELEKLLERHTYELSYASLPTVTAWGEFSRMNLPGVSHYKCKIMRATPLRNLPKMAIA